MLLSIDWDAFSGPRELVFDAPIWGTRDREEDRLAAWRSRAARRGGAGWGALEDDFPLYPGWEALAAYAGAPAWVTLSHADAWAWLERFPGEDVLNLDSHHDLASFSGDPARLRPGNWAGLGLRAGLIRQYTCVYPAWHAGLPVAEGFDLERTGAELAPLLAPELLARVTLTRAASPGSGLPDPAEVRAVLLVQSPAWTSPAHDGAFAALAGALRAAPLAPPLVRPG
ncbi:arginase [Deinococcus petrolearius]|uniref:Arginase n=1 Tax=Deinococcus petrolearius TaxID=1751295 RepID=A0ABW1DEW1_9DEIO